MKQILILAHINRVSSSRPSNNAEQPRFKVVSDLYYRGSVGALCFFDITNQDSYLNLVNWIDSYWKLNGQGKRPLLIVGAKGDLRKDPNVPNLVSTQHGIDFAAELTERVKIDHDFNIHYIETSAKENINVEEAFQLLTYEIIKVYYQIVKPLFLEKNT